jgi:hypothetical protein
MKLILQQSHIFLLLIFTNLSLWGQCPSTTNLTTLYASNNGQRGAMFNVEALNTITITCFDASLYAGTTSDYEIYYRTSAFQGFENNAAGWTLLGQATALTSAGANTPTNIPINVNVTIPAGQTYAFYVTNTFGGGLNYTDGVGNTANIIASNTDMNVYEGVGKSYPFGLTFSTRNFNGTIHYVPGTLLPVELLDFEGEADAEYNKISWSTASEQNSDYFELEASADGMDFETITQLDATTYSNEKTTYKFDHLRKYPRTYYRLKMVDQDASFKYSDLIVVEGEMSELLLVYPNPTSNLLKIQTAYTTSFHLVDVLGRNLLEIQFPQAAIQEISMAEFPNGIYFLVDQKMGRKIKIIKAQ